MNGSRPSTRRLKPVRVVGTAVFVVLAAATFTYVMPRVVELSGVWDGVRALTWRELGVLGLASAAHIAIAGTVLLAATPGLTYRQALVVNEASTATSNTVPGGTALALGLVYRMLGSWGFSKTRSTLAITVSGTWNILSKLAMTVVAVMLLAARGDASGGRLVAGAAAAGALVVAAVAIAVVVGSEDFSTRAGEAAGRLSLRLRRRLRHQPTDGWGQAAAKYRARAIGLIRRCWTRLTLSALASYLSLYLILLVTLRAVGVSNDELNWIDVLAVLAIVRLIAAIPLSPGGLGIVELGLIAGLASYGGDRAEIVVAVLAYRLLTYVVPIVVGFFAYVYWRNNNSWLNSAPPFDPRLTTATSNLNGGIITAHTASPCARSRRIGRRDRRKTRAQERGRRGRARPYIEGPVGTFTAASERPRSTFLDAPPDYAGVPERASHTAGRRAGRPVAEVSVGNDG
jgi:uncharacterized membrane protein YbhN (UPF0104 family)